MADANAIDVLMKVVITGKGLPMEAESLTELSPLIKGDSMVEDFTANHFCELQSFNFSAGIQSLVKKKGPEEPKPAPEPADDITLAVLQSQRDRYKKRKRGDFVDMLPVSYTRILDSASPTLFKALCDCTTMASVSIVKRKGAGAESAGLGYLRLDFQDVLLTELSWKDSEHLMIESGTFIYRRLAIKYLAQKPDGSLIPGSSADWQMRPTRTGA